MNISRALLPILVFSSVTFAAPPHWVVTWGASPAPQLTDEQMKTSKLMFDNRTLREIVHISLGGAQVRVRLSNAFGKETVEIGAAHIAIRSKDSSVVQGSDRALTFGGRPGVSIPANAPVLSDPVNLDIAPAADLAISIFIPKPAAGGGIHYSALQTSYTAAGDQTAAASLTDADKIASWIFLTGVEVAVPQSAATLMAFGDSITDGAHSTDDMNRRWPDVLAERLRQASGHKEIGVVDAGIGGNRILHDGISNVRFGVSALARFDRDVLAQPGVKYVIVLEGINDLGHPGSSAPMSEQVNAQDIIAGLKQLIERAHEKGIKIFGATITPFEGTVFKGYFTPEKETYRKAVNEWIRTGGAFDGVVDFEKAVKDPSNGDKMLPAYDSGDHLHPDDAGYKAMADSINLNLFR